MKIRGSLYLLITVIALGLVSVIVIFKECKPIPPDDSQVKIDSILIQRDRREDSLNRVIADAQNSEARAWIAADSFSVQSRKVEDLARRYQTELSKANTQRLLAKGAGNDSLACAWGDSVITAAFKTIAAKDTVIALKDSVIDRLSLALIHSEHKATALQGSRDGFKSDFMKLQTDVVKPMQIQLATERHQHATNRFWKKVFAGTTAILATNAIVDLLKK